MPVQNTSEKFSVYFGDSGLTLTTTLSKAGGSFSSVAPTVTDASNGYYIITPLAAHRDTLGVNSWLFVSGDESRPYVERVESTDNAAITSALGNVPTATEISDRLERDGGPLDTAVDSIAALTGPNAIAVTVLNDDDSTAVENALVRIYKSGSTESRYTAADGTISDFAVESATWDLAISADGFTSQVIELVVTANVSQTVRLVPNAESVTSSAGWIG